MKESKILNVFKVLKKVNTKSLAELYSGKNILIVEDDPDFAVLYNIALNGIGKNHSYATDGAQGAMMAENFPFDIIFMDIDIPKVDGVKAASFLKESNYTKDVPIVAVTSEFATGAKVKNFDFVFNKREKLVNVFYHSAQFVV